MLGYNNIYYILCVYYIYILGRDQYQLSTSQEITKYNIVIQFITNSRV